MTVTLGLVDVLKLAGFEPAVPAKLTKLVRHQDDRYPVEELLRHGWLELYQSYQSRPVFHGAKHVVSFYGLPGTRAAFYGVYEIRDRLPGRKGPILASCPWSRKWNREARFFYDLKRQARFDGLRDRLVIDWGPGYRSWVQNLADKEVLEILQTGRKLPPFADYLEFSLGYSELVELFDNEEAHRDWRTHLSAVGGIYLVLAERTGHLYVGSAYGAKGVWGRWRKYATSATSGHGGNARLRDLMKRDSHYPARFRFSLLQILPRTMARREVLECEKKYKQKLGTRAIGLNTN